jgi:hypothetical protein
MADEFQNQVSIIESYQNYSPSFNAAKLVRQMLRKTPPKFLIGLRSVVLTNKAALSRKDQQRKLPSRGSRVVKGESLGYYSQEWKGEPAHITLLVDNVEKQCSRGWVFHRFLRVCVFADLFFHELGHHIHRVHRPLYKEREDVADMWSKKLSRKFLADRYWYMLPVTAPVSLARNVWNDFAGIIRRSRKKS